MALRITNVAAERIRVHGAFAYPQECCGALLGREQPEGREISSVLPLPNRREDSPRNRFSLTPDDVRDAERTAVRLGLELVGWYHSHPDSPARPSEFDRDHAWPWYSYVILNVERGRPLAMTSWRLADDRSAFLPEEIQIEETPHVRENHSSGAAAPLRRQA